MEDNYRENNKNKKQNWKIFGEWGVLSSRENQRTGQITEVRLTKTSWFGKLPKWDLRNWTSDHIAGQGVVIGGDKALFRLRGLLIDGCKQIELEDQDDDE